MNRSRRPYQIAAVEKFMSRHDKRLIFAHATSAGKSLSSIDVANALRAKRILVVCPAVGRPTWVREFAKWSPEHVPHSILYGRTRQGLSKVKVAQRDAAYQADVQVVSYKLLKQLMEGGAGPRDLVVLDELHALRDPLSQQSRAVRDYLRVYPKVPALGLSATPIPTEVKQLWSPLDAFWPGQWGKKASNGGVSWDFQARYCERVENEYGVAYRGARDDAALEALAKRLDPYIHRVTDKEVAPYLPPLHAEPLYLDEKRDEVGLAEEWVETAQGEGATHMAVICYNRATAHAIGEALGVTDVVTGEMPAEARQLVLDRHRAAPQGILVATCESVRESVSLSFCSRALILQWRTSPAQAIQLLGRFPRQDAVDLTRPTFVQYAVQPGDEARAELLNTRVASIQKIMASDRKSEQLVEIFKPRELTDDMLDNMFQSMMNSYDPTRAEWMESSDED